MCSACVAGHPACLHVITPLAPSLPSTSQGLSPEPCLATVSCRTLLLKCSVPGGLCGWCNWSATRPNISIDFPADPGRERHFSRYSSFGLELFPSRQAPPRWGASRGGTRTYLHHLEHVFPLWPSSTSTSSQRILEQALCLLEGLLLDFQWSLGQWQKEDRSLVASTARLADQRSARSMPGTNGPTNEGSPPEVSDTRT